MWSTFPNSLQKYCGRVVAVLISFNKKLPECVGLLPKTVSALENRAENRVNSPVAP